MCLMLGNLATSAFYRIPRNIPMGNGHKPMCSNCGHVIKFPLFLPIIGIILSKGECSACKAKVPLIYTLFEICTAIFAFIPYIFLQDERVVLLIFLSVLLVLSFFLYLTSGTLPAIISQWVFFLAVLNNVAATNCNLLHITLNMCCMFLLIECFKKTRNLTIATVDYAFLLAISCIAISHYGLLATIILAAAALRFNKMIALPIIGYIVLIIDLIAI